MSDPISLRSRNYVRLPTSVLALAKLAGMTGTISLRELLGLLGPAAWGPRPFYVIGHNTNTTEEVTEALAIGANALEIDITTYAPPVEYPYPLPEPPPKQTPADLCVAHRGVLGNAHGHDDDPGLVDFLKFLRTQADALPDQFALLMFDVKPYAATPELGKGLMDAVREHLIDPERPLNIIYSVASWDMTSFFDQIAPLLGPRECLMIDEEDSPTAVENHFRDKLGLRPQGYGNGSSFWNDADSEYRTAIGDACWIRAQRDGFHWVYAWSVQDEDHQRQYMRIGVDGMVSDIDTCGQMIDLIPKNPAPLRLATRADNPFMPPNAAYALSVRTGDDGTDSNITFTLHGTAGTTTMVVDAGWSDRMESGQTNLIVMQSPDLGDLTSISVQSDRTGIYADWYLIDIKVESFRYQVNKTATFKRLIDDKAVHSADLV